MTLQEKLQALFDEDSFLLSKGKFLLSKGMAFIWVHSTGKDGKKYAGCHHIKEEMLKGRNFKIIEHHNGKLGIELLDTLFDPKTFKHDNPIW